MATVPQFNEDDQLRHEIVSLFQYIRRLKAEIAQLNTRMDEQDRFQSMSEHLDEIVQATEGATHTILQAVEEIETAVEEVRTASEDPGAVALCDKISGKTTAAIEACTFQDVTGQRVSKIVKSIQFVEDRINVITDLWGRSDIERLADRFLDPNEMEEDSGEVLSGPALSGAGISQDEIDKLFD